VVTQQAQMLTQYDATDTAAFNTSGHVQGTVYNNTTCNNNLLKPLKSLNLLQPTVLCRTLAVHLS